MNTHKIVLVTRVDGQIVANEQRCRQTPRAVRCLLQRALAVDPDAQLFVNGAACTVDQVYAALTDVPAT